MLRLYGVAGTSVGSDGRLILTGENRSSRRKETAPLLLRAPQIPHGNQSSINTMTKPMET